MSHPKHLAMESDTSTIEGRTIGRVAHFGILLAILASNFLLRCYLDQASHITSFLRSAYPEKLPEIYAMSWWQYLLPLPSLTGAWQTTSILLVHALELVFGSPPRVFYFANAILVISSYIFSWQVFRSLIFTVTFTLCFAWSTINYHVYLISGSVALPLILSYLMFFLFCQYKLMQPGCNYEIWVPLGVLSMLIYALAYEAWLDSVAWMWVAYPFLIALAYRAGDRERVRAGTAILGAVTVAAVCYVIIKSTLGYGQGAGSESEVVFNYGARRAIVGIEDVIVHWFTLVYIAVTAYSPPFLFSGSISAWLYGTDDLIALQHGYHAQKAHLVGYNHLFLWRFYAGFAAAALLYLFWKVTYLAWKTPSRTNVAIFLFISMVLMPGTTHMIVKYRPMHSAPFLGYHSYFGVVGFTLLISFVAMWIFDNFQRRQVAWILIALIWFDVGLCALARPSFLSQMAVEAGFAPYPDPWTNLRNMFRRER